LIEGDRFRQLGELLVDQNSQFGNLGLLPGVVADQSLKVFKVRIDLSRGQGVGAR
jgi:hypothetical protein